MLQNKGLPQVAKNASKSQSQSKIFLQQDSLPKPLVSVFFMRTHIENCFRVSKMLQKPAQNEHKKDRLNEFTSCYKTVQKHVRCSEKNCDFMHLVLRIYISIPLSDCSDLFDSRTGAKIQPVLHKEPCRRLSIHRNNVARWWTKPQWQTTDVDP